MPNNRNVLGRNVPKNAVRRNNGRNNLVIRNVSGKTNSAISYVTLLYCACVILASIVMLILGNQVWTKSTVESDGTRRFSKYEFKRVSRHHVVYPGVEGFTSVIDAQITQRQKNVFNKEKEISDFTFTVAGAEKTIAQLEADVAGKQGALNNAEGAADKGKALIALDEAKDNLSKAQAELQVLKNNLENKKKALSNARGERNSASAGTFDKLKLSMSLRTYNVILVIILVFHLGLASLVSSKL